MSKCVLKGTSRENEREHEEKSEKTRATRNGARKLFEKDGVGKNCSVNEQNVPFPWLRLTCYVKYSPLFFLQSSIGSVEEYFVDENKKYVKKLRVATRSFGGKNRTAKKLREKSWLRSSKNMRRDHEVLVVCLIG